MSIIEPSNTIHVIGSLRSIFFNISDALITTLVSNQQTASFIQHFLALDLDTFCSKQSPIIQQEKDAIKTAQQLLSKWTKAIDWVSLDRLIEMIFEDTHIILKLHMQKTKEKEIQIMKSFKKELLTFIRRHTLTKSNFLTYLKSLIHQSIQFNADQEENAVQLLTIHASKGLEFPCVIVPECDKNITKKPHTPFHWIKDYGPSLSKDLSDTQEKNPLYEAQLTHQKQLDLEEEKRIFYVATTRAKDHLLLTAPPLTTPNPTKIKTYLDLLNMGPLPPQYQYDTPLKTYKTHSMNPLTPSRPPIPEERVQLFNRKAPPSPTIRIVTPSELIKQISSSLSQYPIAAVTPKFKHATSIQLGMGIHKAIELYCRNNISINTIITQCSHYVTTSAQKKELTHTLASLLNEFKTNDFYYSLTPGTQGNDYANFFFNTKQLFNRHPNIDMVQFSNKR